MKKNYLRYIISALMALGFYYYLQVDKKATVIMEDVEYPIISRNNNDYRGVITSRSMSGVYKGTWLFELSNGQKFSADMSFLQIGDSIHRPANNDSIYIAYQTGKQSKIFLYRDTK